MDAEQGKTHGCEETEDFKQRLKAKQERLPKGIRTQIRRLKEAGKLEEVALVRKTAEEKIPRHAIAADEFGKTLKEIICTDDPVEEAAAEIKITWLMHAVGLIETQRARTAQLMEILDAQPPEILPQVEALMPGIVKQVEPFMQLPRAG